MKQDYNTPGLMKFANEAVVNKKVAANWLTPLIAVLSGTAGAAANYDKNDPYVSSGIGATSGVASTLLGKGVASRFPGAGNAALRGAIIGGTTLGGDIFLPVARNAIVANGRLANQQAIESEERIKALKNPGASDGSRGSAVTPSTGSKDSTVTQSLGTKEYLGLGALGAVGAYALYQLARSSKRKADGLETAPVTNVTIAGGSGGSGGGKGLGGSDPSIPTPSAGTLRVTLPTKGKTDNETQVEMPLERIGLSNALLQKIRRDTKRKLRGESDSRTLHILPKEVVN